jgi:hypothetical protein
MATTAQNRNVVVVGIECASNSMAGYSQPEYSFHHSGFVEFCPHRVTACGSWTSPVMVIAIDNLSIAVTLASRAYHQCSK